MATNRDVSPPGGPPMGGLPPSAAVSKDAAIARAAEAFAALCDTARHALEVIVQQAEEEHQAAAERRARRSG